MESGQKRIAKKIVTIIWFLVASIVTGTLLLCFVYMLPADRMKKHTAGDMALLQAEGNYTTFWGDVFVRMHPDNIGIKTFLLNNRGMARDNYTDAIMLGNAVYEDESKNILEKALGIYHYTSDEKSPIDSLYEYLINERIDKENSYSRYWHGYLVALKPLLCVFSYRQIRILNVVLQSILLIILCRKIEKQLGRNYAICLLGAVFMAFPFVIPLCIQYSTAVYVMLLSCIIYLRHMNYWEEQDRSLYYFMLTGIVTSYVDFLTYPIITLGGLLVIAVLMTGEKTGYIIKNSFMWCIGYFGMWFGKWITASSLLKENVVKDGLEQMLFRISDATETSAERRISSLSAIFANFSSMTNIYYMIVFLFLLLFLALEVKKKGNFKLKSVIKQRYFLWIASYPFIWYAVIKNHSYDHSSFTYRALFVTVFALMAMLVRSCEKIDGFNSDYFDKK